jgi:hypothetical protein
MGGWGYCPRLSSSKDTAGCDYSRHCRTVQRSSSSFISFFLHTKYLLRQSTTITQFGILTADVIKKTPPTVTPIVSNLDIYTRWYSNYIPPLDKNIQLQVRHGILGFPLPEISPFDPPILENPAQYIDLRGRQIASIQTFYPLGQNKEFGGLRIDFADGSHEVVHKEEDDPGFHYLKEVVTFDVEAKEVIKKLICYFNSNPSRTTPTVLHGIEVSSPFVLSYGL